MRVFSALPVVEQWDEQSVGRGVADRVVPEVNVDWRRPGQRRRSPMHETLRNLIDEFRTAQDVGVRTLVNDLRIPRPKSGLDWHRYCCEHGLFQVRLIDDVAFYAHGYGVELKIKGLIIDFDWGDKGQGDGFDVWRL
jgi:hypothetical protein